MKRRLLGLLSDLNFVGFDPETGRFWFKMAPLFGPPGAEEELGAGVTELRRQVYANPILASDETTTQGKAGGRGWRISPRLVAMFGVLVRPLTGYFAFGPEQGRTFEHDPATGKTRIGSPTAPAMTLDTVAKSGSLAGGLDWKANAKDVLREQGGAGAGRMQIHANGATTLSSRGVAQDGGAEFDAVGRPIYVRPLKSIVPAGSTDALYPAGNAPVTEFGAKPIPILTYDRGYYGGQRDLDKMLQCIPGIASGWARNRQFSLNYGRHGVSGEGAEGEGVYGRLCVHDGVGRRRFAAGFMPADPAHGGVVDSHPIMLKDGRLLVVFCMTTPSYQRANSARVLINPQDPPALWQWGPWCDLVLMNSFISCPTYLPNGELVGTISFPRQNLTPPYAEETGCKYGFYRITADHKVSFTVLSTVPELDDPATNNFTEAVIGHMGVPNTLFLAFRTLAGYHYRISTDRGATWSAEVLPFRPAGTLGHAASRMAMLQLPDTRWAVLHNVTDAFSSGRTSMAIALTARGASPLGPYPHIVHVDRRARLSYGSLSAPLNDAGDWCGDLDFAYDNGRSNANAAPILGEPSFENFKNGLVYGRLSVASIVGSLHAPLDVGGPNRHYFERWEYMQ